MAVIFMILKSVRNFGTLLVRLGATIDCGYIIFSLLVFRKFPCLAKIANKNLIQSLTIRSYDGISLQTTYYSRSNFFLNLFIFCYPL